MIRLLFIGDIVGRPGREWVYSRLPGFREENGIDLVVANAENAAAGAGLTAAIAEELHAHGVDGITLGDHLWDQRGFEKEIVELSRVCRPANLPARCPGRTWMTLECEGFRLGVAGLLGRQYIGMKADCPFTAADALLEETRGECDAMMFDVHAEATSEKVALGWSLDGRCAAVVGTHTHVPTADARVLPGGTAYITDAGMTGPYASVLGRETRSVLERFLDGMPRRFPVASDDVRLCGVLIDIDPDTARATSIARVEIVRPEKTETMESRKEPNTTKNL